jgi:eukaryotic-like serine/threonine-protein kinase
MPSHSAASREHDPFRIVGTIIDGRYLVERVAARGGFSVVYRARHLGFDSLVALKVLLAPPRQAHATQSELTNALHAEGKMLFELAPLHASFVRVLELGSFRAPDGVLAPYLTLEWLEGTTLSEDARRLRLAGQRLDTRQVLSLFDGIATGLAIAHDHGVAHRDLKPANVFLSRCGDQIVPRLLDFGLAKAMTREADQDQFGDSVFGSLPFTPAWGAPEQWRRALGATGTWTDVHALALMSVELMSGARPLQGQDSAQLMDACLDPARRPTPRTMGVTVSDSIEAVFRKALALDPRQRHRTVGLFWESFRKAAGVEAPHAKSWPLPEPWRDALPGTEATPHETISAQATTASRDSPRRDSRGRTGRQLGLCVAAIGLVLCASRVRQHTGAHLPAGNVAPSQQVALPPAAAPSTPPEKAPNVMISTLPLAPLAAHREKIPNTRQPKQKPDAPPPRAAQPGEPTREAVPPAGPVDAQTANDAQTTNATPDDAELSRVMQQNALLHRK